MTHVLKRPCSGREECREGFDFVAETFTCSLGEWIVPRKPTLRSGFCRAEEILRPCVEIAQTAPW